MQTTLQKHLTIIGLRDRQQFAGDDADRRRGRAVRVLEANRHVVPVPTQVMLRSRAAAATCVASRAAQSLPPIFQRF